MIIMTMRVNESTKAWLRSKSIYVPDDWLEACIEWINNETQDKLQLPDQLNGAVYEQWLLSDLHELQSPCLPEQLISQRKYQLNGGYALQIDSLVDVSKPYYGQMLKVKGSENENVKVTAEPPAPWEPKPTRMLMLKLTDGVTEVQGMEYRQIPCLNEKIKPGTKVLIKGSVLCRNGVLMLKADNVQLLGGEVDTLVEELTPHSVLQQALEKSMQYSGQEYRQTFEPGPVINNKSGKKEQKQEIRNNNGGNSQRTYGTSLSSSIHRQPSVNIGTPPTNRKPIPKQEDEFDDDIAFEFLEDMDDIESVASPEPQNQPRHNPVYTANQGSSRAPAHSKLPKNEKMEAGVSNSYQVGTGKQVTSNINHIPQNTERTNSENNERVTAVPSQTKSPPLPNKPQGRQSLQASRPPALRNTNSSSETPDLFLEEFGDELDDFDFSSFSNTKSGKSPHSSTSLCSDEVKNDLPRTSVQVKIEPTDCASNNIGIKKEPTFGMINNMGVSHQRPSNNTKTTPKDKKMPTPKASSSSKSHTIDSYFSTCSSSCPVAEDAPSRKRTISNTTIIEDFTRIKAPTLSVDALPFTYLSVIKKHPPTNSPIKFKVKCYIATLLDKLDYCKGKMWKLACKINDGSDTMDVNLSNAVLTQFIGFSAADSLEMRKQAQNDHSVREILAEGVQQCQQKLIELLCVMEIQLIPGSQGRPEVTAISMMSDSDVDLLQTRVSDTMYGIS